jgi:hypothetical protein
MSYLKAPRLIFAGQFQADPSTVNNDPEHFNTNKFQSNYTLPGAGATNGWWNPGGTAAWRFIGCTVQRVVYGDGTFCDDPAVDSVVGAPVTGSDTGVEGKLVDLDPEQQMVSEIWGFQVVLGHHGLGFGFRSNFDVAAFADIWTRFPQGQPDSFFGAFYQSVLNILEWKSQGQSRFLTEWAQVLPPGGKGGQLSIKFNVDGYNDTVTSPTFTLGRVVGAIGLYEPTEPVHFVAGRSLSSPQGSWGTAYAEIDGDALVVDLGNSLPTQSAGGPLTTSQGRIYAAALPAAGPVLLGEIEYQNSNWYTQTAGIVSVKLTADQLQLVQSNPLAIAQPSILQTPPSPPLLMESSNGAFVRADQFVFRMDPGEQRSTTFYATQFGQPWANQQISLTYDPTIMQGQVDQGPISGPPSVGTPTSAFTFPTPITTGADGTAALPMTAGNPGNPRLYIDGQVYGVTYGLGATPPPVGSVSNPSQILNALVFSGYQVPDQPNWLEHVQPIFQQYADLYPVMRPIVDLANFGSVIERANILKNVFKTPVTSPNYMPVTRDLSTAKRQMILKWLENPLYMQLDSAADLMQALQVAIELEHSTIPPYLCALYSIKQGANVEVAELIRSVVIEEMLHMALVCNILISLGGKPNIGHAKFVPTYPGALPGGLRAGLIVRLRRCSIEQVRDCFMSIEEPEETLAIRRKQLTPRYPFDPHLFTIGWFYDEVKKSLTELSKQGQITFGHTELQVSEWSGLGKLYVITSLKDALAAIDEIQEQGEGRGPLDPDDAERELAHYYKFAEIVAGRRLVRSGGKFSYTGTPIPFDPDGIWPMMDDPNVVLYPPGSRAQILSLQFAQTYQALLKGLNRTFNGEPSYLPEAIGQMYSLDLAARQLMQTPSGLKEGTTAGPSFQLPVPGLGS